MTLPSAEPATGAAQPEGGPARILAGCVAENSPLYFRRALNLLRSIRWFGGRLAQADLVVCMLEAVEPDYRAHFEALGARVVVVPGRSESPLANALQLFSLPGLAAYETLVLLDCATIVVQDPTSWLAPGRVQARIADVDSVPYATFARLCERFGLELPEARYRTCVDRAATLACCNTAVLAIPPPLSARLLDAWQGYERALRDEPELLGDRLQHSQQVAFALALISAQAPFEELPLGLNFPLSHTHLPPTAEMASCDPVIIHYHHAMDERGSLLPAPYPAVQERIRCFNERVRDEAPAAGLPGPGLAVCITGMHRSGTSLLASLLHACGIHLGADVALSAGASDNPLGFWEHPEFVAIDEALLAAQGGGWDLPPELPAGWERAPALLPLRARAAALLRAHHAAAPAAGFKDPRALLTLPFWRLLRPDLRLVVCLRNPLEVARSLARRNGTSPAAALRLWERSYRQLRATTTPAQRLLVHHDALHHDPAAELARVLAWLDLPATPAAIAAAVAQLRPDLRHQRVTPAQLLASPVPDPVLTLYLDLCVEAGPTLQLALAEQLAEPPGPVLGPDQHEQRWVTLDVEQLMCRLQAALATTPGYGDE